jgi:ectoine hydroxylase
MRLSKGQYDFYEENGFLLITNYFSSDEVETLMAEIPTVFRENSPRRISETSGDVRTVFASHFDNALFNRLSRLPRLVGPASQILGSEVYIHQFKINAKVALGGDRWEWHQDFLYWYKEDAMPAPRVLTAALFLQDVNEFNGPMLIVPGSHKEGMLKIIPGEDDTPDEKWERNGQSRPSWAATLTADLKYKLDKQVFAKLVEKRKIMAVKCPSGSVLFFHGNLLHASASNLSPWDRVCVFITYNSVENTLHKCGQPRPEYIACRDFTPVVSVPDEAILELRAQRSGRGADL